MYEKPNVEAQNLGCNGWTRYKLIDSHVTCGVQEP